MANAVQSRKHPGLIWVSAIVLVGIIVIAIRMLTRERVEVRVALVTYRTLEKTVSTNGMIRPVEKFPAHAPFSGVIEQIYVHVGDHVNKGTLLVRMDDADAKSRLATAQAGLATATASSHDLQGGGTVEERKRYKSDIATATLEQKQAASKLTVEQRLFQKGAASGAEVANAQQQLDSANLMLKNAEARATSRYGPDDLTTASARVADSRAAVSSAHSNIANVDIRSPISGTVYNIPVSQFDYVPAGDDILDVADLNRLQVRAYFDEPEIGKLERGQPVTIVWDAKPNLIWHGHVLLAPTTILTYGTRNVGVCIITVDDPTSDLIPNTNVTVKVTQMQHEHALSIPREALHTEGNTTFVYRLIENKLKRTTVQLGPVVNLTNAEIVSGLAANDVVVLGPKSSLKELSDGLEVKPTE